MLMTTAVALYLDLERPLIQPTTYRWYEQKLSAYAAWLADPTLSVEEALTPARVAQFLSHVQTTCSAQFGRPHSSYTTHGYAQVLRQWVRFLTEEAGLSLALTPQQVRLPRVETRVIQTFTDEQVRALFAAAQAQSHPRLAARDGAILCVLLDTGVRASEVCGLTLARLALERADAFLTVVGKGRKMREVGLGLQTRRALTLYLARWRPAPLMAGDDTLFLNDRRAPLTPDGLDQMLYRLRERAGGATAFPGIRVSAHTFRHTFAVRSLERGMDVYTLSRLLGHTSVVVTQTYLRDFSARSARRASPSLLDTHTGWRT